MVNDNWYLEVRGKDEVEGWFLGMMKEPMPVYSIIDNRGKQEYGIKVSLYQESKATVDKMP